MVMRLRRFRIYFGFIFFLLFISICFIAFANVWLIRSTQKRIFKNPESLPHHQAALVLGTSSKLMGGKPNPFFVNRMDKAAQLFRNDIVDQFILSGDNRRSDYNEPARMRDALLRRGVPDSLITLDSAGLRTFDSILRSRYVFGKRSLIIITQPFHAYRALFLCDYFGIKAVVFAAREPGEQIGLQVYLREIIARAKALLDIYVLGTWPDSLESVRD